VVTGREGTMRDRPRETGAFDALLDRLSARLDPTDAPMWPGGGTIHAAVALLLRPAAGAAGGTVDGSAEILFIRRAQREGDPWSGHIAFPGGRPEAGEADLLAVAVRETVEEVGIDVRRGGRVIGRLPTVEPLSARLPPIDVTPFVALAPEGAAAHPDPGEVEEAFWVPLSELRSAGPSAVVRRVIRGERREWPAYRLPAGPIWGITQRILTGFLALADRAGPS
jgi:8-oxo-dGTP pyrophosphatase MutT (NUDIX family)